MAAAIGQVAFPRLSSAPVLLAALVLAGGLASKSTGTGDRVRPTTLLDGMPATPQVAETYGRLPLVFEAEPAQSGDPGRFRSRGAGYGLFLSPDEAVLLLLTAPPTASGGRRTQGGANGASLAEVHLRLVGADPEPRPVGERSLPGRSHYFLGNDPRKWRTDVAHYARVRYEAVYPGIDLVYYGTQRQLEYDFIVAPGANPRLIRLEVSGADGLRIDATGNLVLDVAGGEIVQRPPRVYQMVDGERRVIDASYVVAGDRKIAFEIAAFDAARPLVIDPVLVYSTYLGGRGAEGQLDIGVDSAGNLYVTGVTNSFDFPTKDPLQASPLGTDVFVTKLDSSGSLVYSTYLGGSSSEGSDGTTAIAVDTADNAYVTATTLSQDFPIVNAVQPTYGGGYSDVFVAKLNAQGSALLYSTYLGGSSYDYAGDIAVDDGGGAYVTGQAGSSDFPTVNALQPEPAGSADVFIAKLAPQGASLVYSTYLGGNGDDDGRGIAVDGEGNASVTGFTASSNFPTRNAMQSVFGQGPADAFVTRLGPQGAMLLYSTYLGGSSTDQGTAIAVDDAGSTYVAGVTASTDFPTRNAVQPNFAGGNVAFASGDAFVTKVDPTGTAFAYSTYLGGSSDDDAAGIAVDAAGRVYVTGRTGSSDFPQARPLQPNRNPNVFHAYVTELAAAGDALVYSTYLGGSDYEQGDAIAVDGAGNAFVAGITGSGDFPTINALQPGRGSQNAYDGFVTKIADAAPPLAIVIDIRPGNPRNPVSPRAHGLLAVAVLTTQMAAGESLDFDALQADPTSVRFGPQFASPLRDRVMDVDHDGDADLILMFQVRQSGIRCGDTVATVTGMTYDGRALAGRDTIRTVACQD